MGSVVLRFFESLLDPFVTDPMDERPLPRTLMAFLWACTRGIRGFLLVMTLATGAIGIFEAWLFSVLGHLVDWLAQVSVTELWARRYELMWWVVVAVVVSVLVVGLQSALRRQVLAGNYAMRLRWVFHRRMLSQSMSFYQDEFAGRVATKVMQTALAIRDSWFILADILVYVVIYFATILVVVGAFNNWLLLPFLSWLFLYGIAVWYYVPRLARAGKAQADARSMMTGRVTDAYTNIVTVKLFSHTHRESDYARSAMQEFLNTVYKQMRWVTSFEIVNHTLSMLLIVSTVVLSLYLWVQHSLAIGSVAAATAVALRLNGISHWVMWEVASLFEQIGTVQDGLTTLSVQRSVVDSPVATELVVPKGEIVFEDVTFAYGQPRPADDFENESGGQVPPLLNPKADRAKIVIERFNLRVRPGEKIGLVGRSGAGKSTLVNLLLRFYDVQSGRILIDGQDIALVSQDSLRSHIGMVTQDTSLLHRSVRDNIVYGNPNATDETVWAVAQRSESAGFINSLRDPAGRVGLAAHVGERGVKLSGGQRQRIAIARVMLKDAPILLLDEATSALDSEVEAVIQQSLYRLMEGKTVLAIAHRLSTIAQMDRLIVLDEGRIVEAGSHSALLAQGGLYARLWAHQTGGYLGDSTE
jgi:ATP-binding cassette, subfamily B, multidrug efflux pump